MADQIDLLKMKVLELKKKRDDIEMESGRDRIKINSLDSEIAKMEIDK
jgi:FtsZ-binding cell division protein ZapB